MTQSQKDTGSEYSIMSSLHGLQPTKCLPVSVKNVLFELVRQFCHTACNFFFIFYFFFFLMGNPGNNKCHLAASKWNKQPQSVLVGEKFPGISRSAHSNSSCHFLVVTHKSPLIKNICLLLLGFFFFFGQVFILLLISNSTSDFLL